ncbi:MAG: NUDIX domain-containing protein [Patescibacteria group bacterium]
MEKIKYPFTIKEFRAIYSKVPRLCVELIIKDSNGILLTLRRTKSWRGLWHIPGGTLYYNETISDCIHRIAMDELGIRVKIKKFLGYNEYLDDEKKSQEFGTTIGLLFLCAIDSGDLRGSNQAEKINFYKKLPTNIIPQHRTFLKKMFKIK